MKAINKAEYLNIVNNPNLNIVVKKVKKGNSFIETVFNGVEVVAQRIITATGVTYLAS